LYNIVRGVLRGRKGIRDADEEDQEMKNGMESVGVFKRQDVGFKEKKGATGSFPVKTRPLEQNRKIKGWLGDYRG